MLKEYNVEFRLNGNLKLKQFEDYSRDVATVLQDYLVERNNVSLETLPEHFSGDLLRCLMETVPRVIGSIVIGTSPFVASKKVAGCEMLPYLDRYSNGDFVEKCYITHVATDDGEKTYYSFHVIPSSTAPSKQVTIFNQETLTMVIIRDGTPAYFCRKEDGENTFVLKPALGTNGETLIRAIRSVIEEQVSLYVEQQPQLVHSNTRRQIQEYLKNNNHICNQLTIGKYHIVNKGSVYMGPRANGSTKKPHERESHQRVYRNADGSVRKVVKIPACKIHGGSQASGNIKINLT